MVRALKWIVVGMLLAIAPAAVAQLAKGQGVFLNQKEARAALFGIDMTGYSRTAKFAWRECIDPRGLTLYTTPAGIQKGKLRIDELGRACFSYDDTNYKEEYCFRVERNGTGILFDGAEINGGMF